MQPESKQVTATVGSHQITIETGKLAGQAGGSVTIRLGDSMIFAAATMANTAREGIDFFPLTVDYEERMYAGGRIPGSFFRREGRPSRMPFSRLASPTARCARSSTKRCATKCRSSFLHLCRPGKPARYSGHQRRFGSADHLRCPVGRPGRRGARRPHQWPIRGQPDLRRDRRIDLDLRIAGTRDAILMVECGAKRRSPKM
jgi:polyribonucleotide nucleotidyltransferase